MSHPIPILTPKIRAKDALLTLLLSTLLFLAAVATHAQVVGGTIAGTVTDPSGALVSNASILIHNDDTNALRSTSTTFS